MSQVLQEHKQSRSRFDASVGGQVRLPPCTCIRSVEEIRGRFDRPQPLDKPAGAGTRWRWPTCSLNCEVSVSHFCWQVPVATRSRSEWSGAHTTRFAIANKSVPRWQQT